MSTLRNVLLLVAGCSAKKISSEDAILQKRAESLGVSFQQFMPNRTGPLTVGPDAGTVVIVGANGGIEVGFFGQRGFRVVGVECLPREYARLQVEHVRNPCVTMINGCASNEFGLTYLHLAGDSSSTVAANIKAEGMKARSEPAVSIPVPTFKLDPILKSYGDHIAVVQVDVQGAEFGVFQGLEAILTAHRPVVLYEYYMDMTHRSRRLLEGLGYTCDEDITHDMLCWPRPSDAQAAYAAATKLPVCKWQGSRWCPQLACQMGNYKTGVAHPNFG